MVLEEELRRPLGCLARPPGTSRARVLVQPPHGRERFVEGRAPPASAVVAVPAAVRPLPLDERACEQLDALVSRHPEPGADGEGVPLLGGAPSDEASDGPHAAAVARPGQPVEHRLSRPSELLVRLRLELDEGDQPPVRSRPLRVRVNPETSVTTLPAEQSSNERTGPRGVLDRLAQQIPLSEPSDGRLARAQEPGDRLLRTRLLR